MTASACKGKQVGCSFSTPPLMGCCWATEPAALYEAPTTDAKKPRADSMLCMLVPHHFCPSCVYFWPDQSPMPGSPKQWHRTNFLYHLSWYTSCVVSSQYFKYNCKMQQWNKSSYCPGKSCRESMSIRYFLQSSQGFLQPIQFACKPALPAYCFVTAVVRVCLAI